MVARWPGATVPLPGDLTLTMRVGSTKARLPKGLAVYACAGGGQKQRSIFK
jgi:hypothetical protein